MKTYQSNEELKNEIQKSFEKYISEFDNIPENLKDKSVEEVDRTPAENLSYQVGWTTLLLKWEKTREMDLKSRLHPIIINGIKSGICTNGLQTNMP